ncbi:MAG: hypothetical protein SGJ24_09990 [Chloroflexota bacterium]|nr:hypothetical protein [Chloroflexota bacterium]
MDAREAFFGDLAENGVAVLLLAQMGGTPDELQCVVETATYDPEAHGLRPRAAYAVRALSVVEHRLSLGIAETVQLVEGDGHPLLYHTNTPRVAVHFDGRAKDLNELALDIQQAYVSVFLQWRHLVDRVEDINRTMPLLTLLERGYGLLGTMPKPLAERMARVLAHHGVGVSMSEDTGFRTHDGAGRSALPKLLTFDEGYILALDFSFDRMGTGGR